MKLMKNRRLNKVGCMSLPQTGDQFLAKFKAFMQRRRAQVRIDLIRMPFPIDLVDADPIVVLTDVMADHHTKFASGISLLLHVARFGLYLNPFHIVSRAKSLNISESTKQSETRPSIRGSTTQRSGPTATTASDSVLQGYEVAPGTAGDRDDVMIGIVKL